VGGNHLGGDLGIRGGGCGAHVGSGLALRFGAFGGLIAGCTECVTRGMRGSGGGWGWRGIQALRTRILGQATYSFTGRPYSFSLCSMCLGVLENLG
jgi:hypothetical protein